MFPTWELLTLLVLAGADAPRDPLLTGLEELFDPPTVLRQIREPTVCVLDTQHPDTVRRKLAQKPPVPYLGRKLQGIVRQLCGSPCILLHYCEARREDLRHPHLKAVLLSARSHRINKQIDDELFAIIRELPAPMIGFCGGHQLIAQAYGGEIALMRPLRPGETDTNPKYNPGRFKEWGFLPVETVKRDPLFNGLPDRIIVREMHAWEITRLPDEFVILASTQECRVQVIKHRDRPLYGTQFHPEAYDAENVHGRTLIANFLEMAGLTVKRESDR